METNPLKEYQTVLYGMRADRLLDRLEIPRYYTWYGYIKEAIMLSACDGIFPGYVGRNIYSRIADSAGSTPSRVERDIRYAVITAWRRGYVPLLTEYFGYSASGRYRRPSNLEFLRLAVKYVMNEQL